MDFASFKLGAKKGHNMLMLLHSREPFKGLTFDCNFVMIPRARKVKNLDQAVGIGLKKSFFYLLWRHDPRVYQRMTESANCDKKTYASLYLI